MSGAREEPRDRKLDPDELRLRAVPPAVTRISRRALMLLGACGTLAIVGALVYALDPPRLFRPSGAPELFNTDVRPSAEGLAKLPRDYAAMPRPAPPPPPPPPPQVPQLGPPLPGDLGRPLLRAQGDRGPAVVQPDPKAQKREQETEQAMRSAVFFQLANRRGEDASRLGHRAEPALISREGDTVGIDREPEPGAHDQDRKRAFLREPADTQVRSHHRVQRPISRDQLMAGTVIPAALVTGIDSDLPGFVKAQVTEHVRDSLTGRQCLVPQGSVLVGTYDSRIAFGQRRLLLAWTRLIRPDGSSVLLHRLPAADPAGKSGLEDEVDYHWGRILAAAAISTVLGIGAELGASGEDRLIAALHRGGQDSINRSGQEIFRRNLDIQPTLTLRPGLPLRVVVQRDIPLPPMEGACRT